MSFTLFQMLQDQGEAGIDRLISERSQEGLQLDFKQKTDPENGDFFSTDRKVLAKALSAFSNSAGGLIIWGIEAKKGSDGIDCAQAPAVPIADIAKFSGQANFLVGQLIQPKHEDVQIHSILSSRKEGYGYLLIWIDRSERRPHRSEATDQKQYFKRMGVIRLLWSTMTSRMPSDAFLFRI